MCSNILRVFVHAVSFENRKSEQKPLKRRHTREELAYANCHK